METLDLFINGKYEAPQSGKYMEVVAPATGQVYRKLACAGKDDLDKAIESARDAFQGWSMMSIANRSKILGKLADLIEQNLERLAQAETQDTGKPITASRTIDIPRAAANFRFFAGAITNFSTSAHVEEGVAINYTRRAPLGLVGCISPWNLPLYLFTWKIAPALAMGNCVIGKPSEITPYTATLLGKLANEAGIPPGVLNILHGPGAEIGDLIVNHSEIKAVSFTGGTATGKLINLAAASVFKKVSLELGGKNPTIIFDDCDLKENVNEFVRSSFSNQGQICLCGSRLLVQASVYDQFKKLFLAEINKIHLGDPLDPKTTFGAVISSSHLDKIKGFVQEAERQGGRILTGGKPFEGDLGGFFYEPTVIEGLAQSCQINQEEVFGPVVTLQPFIDEEEAIALANDVDFGLACSIWTPNVYRAQRVAHKVTCGVVWINTWMHRDLRTPFGGMKSSGVGREGGDEALRFFSEVQNICIKMA